MKLSNMIAAAAIATTPVMAAATTIVPIEDGGTTVVTFDDIYEFDIQITAGDFEHTFIVESAAAGVASVSLTALIAGVFEGLTVSWSGGNTGGANDVVSTEFAGAGSQDLLIVWDSTLSTQDFDGSVQITSVPVPAGLLLMGTALAGLGALRRRK